MNTRKALCGLISALILVPTLGYVPAASASITLTNFTNITLTNSQVEVGGDTTDNPNVVNGPVGPLLAYTASASAGFLNATYGGANLNDGDIGVGILSDGTYTPFRSTAR